MALIAFDFDGVCRHLGGSYDYLEQDAPGAARTMHQLRNAGHVVKILTARCVDDHDECRKFLDSNGLVGVEVEGSSLEYNASSKVFNEWDWLIDDADELAETPGVIFFENWRQVRERLVQEGLLPVME